ncbi:MAG TPA: phosphodiester glycosidase family protein [Chloroflexia bacterium]|nr:phosphodiester glycosidase family protein [Chloroflexia bacterium]
MSSKRKLLPLVSLVLLAVVLGLILTGIAGNIVDATFGGSNPKGVSEAQAKAGNENAKATPTLTSTTLTTTQSPTATTAPTATATPQPTATPSPTATATATPFPTITPVITASASKVPFSQRFTFRKNDIVEYLKPGVIHVKRQAPGPLNINILFFDLTAPEFNLRVALKDNWLSGVERTSSFAKENNALAAVNGDLFSGVGLPQGMTMSDGKLALAPKHRATFAYSPTSGPFIGYFTEGFTWPSSIVAASGERHSLEVLNTTCKENWLCLYNDLYHSLPYGSNEVKVTLNSLNEVTAITQEGKLAIPSGNQVLLGKGQAGKWLLENVKVGDKLTLNLVTDPPYDKFQQIVSGGPVFLRHGQFVQDCMCNLDDCGDTKQKDVTCEEFTTDWKLTHYLTIQMPRNGIGYNADKSVLMVAVVDGYQPGFSIGITQKAFADLFLEFNMESAMELDGGGSATMWLNGKLASHPSDGGGSVERMVPDAVIFQWNDSAGSNSTLPLPNSTETPGNTDTTTTPGGSGNSGNRPTPTGANSYSSTPAPTRSPSTRK